MKSKSITTPCILCGATKNKCKLIDQDECENLKLSNFKESVGHIPKPTNK